MIEIAKMIRREDCAKQLSALMSKMKFDWLTKDTELRSHKVLIEFLEKEVLYQIYESDCPIDESIKERIRHFHDRLKQVKTPEEVIDEFWNAIKIKGEVYDEVKEHNLIAFEDVCAKFAAFCYAE